MAQYPANIDLSELAAGEGFQINGAAAHYAGGFPAAAAGDINGDGFADLIVGSHPASPNGLVNAGAAYALLGSATGFANPLTLGVGPGVFRMNGEAAYDFLGVTLDSAGDFNGDGFADMVLGAPGATAHGDFTGAGYVVFGAADLGGELNLTSLNGANGFRMNGERTGDRAARAVASAGDVNGDGFDDIIIGAYRADPDGVRTCGASYVVFGSPSISSSVLELSSLTGANGFRISGVARGDFSGFSVASAGDVNGDGFADVIVGAYLADPLGRDASGTSYVVFGKASGFDADLNLSSLDGQTGFRIDGELAGDHSGFSVARAGDVNGDGIDDIIIGANLASPLGRSGAGASYVVFGTSSGFAADLGLDALDGSNGFRISGETAGDNSGSAVAAAGDVNGDGFADVIVGAYLADPHGGNEGASYVVFGKASGFAADLDLATLDGNNGFKISGYLNAGRSGRSVATAGDLNGDGFGDLIISAPFASENGGHSGAANVVFGRAPDASVTRVGSESSQKIIGGSFDDHLSGLGGNDTLLGGAGNDVLDGGAGLDKIFGNDGGDTLVVKIGDLANGEIYDGGAGADTLMLGNSMIADFTSATLASLESFVGSLGNDTVTLSSAQFVSFTGAGIDLAQGTDTLNVAVSGSADFAAAFPGLRRVETLNMTGASGTVRLTVPQLGKFASIDAGLTVILTDKAATLQSLTATQIGQLAGKRIDAIDSTNNVLTLTAAQVQALGAVELTASDFVSYQDTGANIAALTPAQLGALAAKGVDRLDASDGVVSVTVAGLQALGSMVFTAADTVTLADTGANIAGLTAPQIAALFGQGIDKVDATDDALSLGIGQFSAFGMTVLSADDALTLAGTTGNDKISFSSQPFSVLDRIDGGAGTDSLSLGGNYGSLVFQAGTMTNIEKLTFVAGHSYDLALADANVGAGQRLTVSGSGLHALDSLMFDGSAETDGRFMFRGGAGGDTFTGGTGADDITMAGGADLVRYTAAAQSTSIGHDTITGFDAAVDHLHVWSGVTAVDAPITTGALSKASFDTDLAADTAGLAAGHAALFTAGSGDLAGVQFLVVDTNGVAGYQAGSDLVVQLNGATHLDQFGAATFT